MWKSTRKALIGGFVIGSGFMWGAMGVLPSMFAHFGIGGFYVWLAVAYAREERARHESRFETLANQRKD